MQLYGTQSCVYISNLIADTMCFFFVCILILLVTYCTDA